MGRRMRGHVRAMKRAEIWKLLQSDYPDVAQVLTEVRRVFGKTSLGHLVKLPTPTIKVKGETVYSPVLALRERRDGCRRAD